jgi:ATP-dependent DNA helicase PIF1
MNTLQQKAFNLICNNKNVFITGGAGVGKSYVIQEFVKFIKSKNIKNIGITSTTGISSLLIGGSTLHSFLGIGLGNSSNDSLFTKIKGKNKLWKRWRTLDILIIDEVSMLSPKLFDKLNGLAKRIRRNEKPFGGIQLILSGDFCQLPPVSSDDMFLFESISWKECIDEIIYLKEVIRQTDIDFINCLNEIRLGNISDESKLLLNNRLHKKIKNDYGISPTRLYPLHDNVNSINSNELENIATEIYEYEMTYELFYPDEVDTNSLDKLLKTCPAQVHLELCINCQVILIFNLAPDSGLVNGSRGIVVDFIDDMPVVKFMNGVKMTISYQNWDIESPDGDKIIMSIKQIPLKLGYAATIHSSQGSTLDCALINLNNIFGYGMAYVALSRVKNLEGLTIDGINFNKIKAHPKCIEFYNNI